MITIPFEAEDPNSWSIAESGRLEFNEFVQLAAKFIVEEDAEAMQKELREAFRLYDKQGNGYIPTSCLKEILRELDDQLTDGELDGMIEEIDSDGSGTVDFDGALTFIPVEELSTDHNYSSLSQSSWRWWLANKSRINYHNF